MWVMGNHRELQWDGNKGLEVLEPMCMYPIGCCSDPEEESCFPHCPDEKLKCERSPCFTVCGGAGFEPVSDPGPVYFIKQPWRAVVHAELQFIAIG